MKMSDICIAFAVPEVATSIHDLTSKPLRMLGFLGSHKPIGAAGPISMEGI
jgi:hypothetical protein